jgi:hypothetical protein
MGAIGPTGSTPGSARDTNLFSGRKLTMTRTLVALLAMSTLACGGSKAGPTPETSYELRGPTRSDWTLNQDSTALELSIEIKDADDLRVTAFTPIHTKPMHLVAIGSGLTMAAHEHPDLGADGLFTGRVPLATLGSFILFDEYDPEGDLPQTTDRLEVDTTPEGSDFELATWDFTTRERTVDGLVFKLTRDHIMLGHPMPVVVEVSNPDGTPAELDTWLGEKGHMFAVQDLAPKLYHFHPGGHGPHLRARGTPLNFAAEVDRAGNYRLFVQVVKAGALVPTTVSFDVTVR